MPCPLYKYFSQYILLKLEFIYSLIYNKMHIIILQQENQDLTERRFIMSNKNRIEVPEAKNAMEKFKMEVASELGVDLKSENLTARDAGRVGGNIVKKLIERAESEM